MADKDKIDSEGHRARQRHQALRHIGMRPIDPSWLALGRPHHIKKDGPSDER